MVASGLPFPLRLGLCLDRQATTGQIVDRDEELAQYFTAASRLPNLPEFLKSGIFRIFRFVLPRSRKAEQRVLWRGSFVKAAKSPL